MNYAASPKPVLGPCACQDCREPLYWARRNTTVLHVTVGSLRWRDWNGHIHACRGRQRRYNGRLKAGRYPQIRHETIHHGLVCAGARARETWDNTGVGSSDVATLARMHATPFGSLTLSGGVAASRGQD